MSNSALKRMDIVPLTCDSHDKQRYSVFNFPRYHLCVHFKVLHIRLEIRNGEERSVGELHFHGSCVRHNTGRVIFHTAGLFFLLTVTFLLYRQTCKTCLVFSWMHPWRIMAVVIKHLPSFQWGLLTMRKIWSIKGAVSDSHLVKISVKLKVSLFCCKNRTNISGILSPDWTRVGARYQKMSFLCTAERRTYVTDILCLNFLLLVEEQLKPLFTYLDICLLLLTILKMNGDVNVF